MDDSEEAVREAQRESKQISDGTVLSFESSQAAASALAVEEWEKGARSPYTACTVPQCLPAHFLEYLLRSKRLQV